MQFSSLAGAYFSSPSPLGSTATLGRAGFRQAMSDDREIDKEPNSLKQVLGAQRKRGDVVGFSTGEILDNIAGCSALFRLLVLEQLVYAAGDQVRGRASSLVCAVRMLLGLFCVCRRARCTFATPHEGGMCVALLAKSCAPPSVF